MDREVEIDAEDLEMRLRGETPRDRDMRRFLRKFDAQTDRMLNAAHEVIERNVAARSE